MVPNNDVESVPAVAQISQKVLDEESSYIGNLVQQEKAKQDPNALSRSGGVSSREEIDNVVTKILKDKNDIEPTAKNKAAVKLAIAILAQEGATSPKFAISRNRTFGDITVYVKDVTAAAHANNTTFRRLARGLRNLAVEASTELTIEGNLAKAYRLEHPSAQFQELVWASDFQTFTDNKAMPDNVHAWLLQNFANRFKPKTNKN